MTYEILVTDYAWADLDTERDILKPAGAGLIVAETGEEAELVHLAPRCRGILTTWKRVSRKVIEHARNCVAIGRYGVGLDNIDVEAATEHGIVVTRVPDYCMEEVAEHALALLLACARKVAVFDRAIKSGRYDLRAEAPLFRISGKTLGILGFGRIGQCLARKAQGLGLHVIVCDPLDTPSPEPVERVSLDQLLGRSDFISVHVPLTAETRHLFGPAAFEKMKRTAFLINTSRGSVVDTASLVQALDSGLIAGAGLDVLEQEPPAPDDRITAHPKILVTPHAAFYSEESLIALRRGAASQMADVLLGRRPRNVVNPEVLDRPELRARLAGAEDLQATAGD